ncbi:MAG: hypothetical protein JOZ18_17735 [Chloroflexi bacterium]|nr:hypothetical protein [Chloroflexota bacterium]
MASNPLLLHAMLFHATRLRDTIIAQGHAMPIDLKYTCIGDTIDAHSHAMLIDPKLTIDDTGIWDIESGPVFVNAGVSVPISRGNPPPLIR